MDWFTSDWHLEHKNIVDYCNRPFRKPDGQIDIDAHDDAIIGNINSCVKKSDRLFVLGDVGMGRDPKKIAKKVERIECKQRFLVYGNHDNSDLRKILDPLFQKAEYYMELRDKDKTIILSHYPFLRWNQSHFGSWMLHGHCHGELEYPFQGRIMDVGVDAHNLFPVSREAVEYYMRGIDPLPHHYYKPGEQPR